MGHLPTHSFIIKINKCMFGSSNKNKEASKSKTNNIMPSSTGHSLNSLVKGTTVEGIIKSQSDIRVDGTIKGNLNCDAKVIIGPSGHIDGEIKCKNAVIEGRFEGILSVAELLHIRESANVRGEVTYGKLVVQSGAVINGSWKVVGQDANGSSKNKKDAKNIVTNSKSSNGQNIAGKFKKEIAN
jgi:cytoskeletal protein CcmA (bactofilin family)